jgi:uncharacterized protein
MSVELIERFYTAFNGHDGQTMSACYTPDARFSDPAFGELRGNEVGAMWRMLTGRSQDLRVELREHDSDGERGHAHWIATYTFSTGRPVVNDIRASFRFADGLIAEHDDSFDLRRWAAQAIGLHGNVIALVPPLRAGLQRKARAQLDSFISEEL